MDIKERLRYFSSKSEKGKSAPLKNKTFSGITLDLSRNFVKNDVFIKMKSLLIMNKFSEKRKKLFTNKLISKTESQQVSFIYYRNSRMYDKAIEKMSKFYLQIKENKIKSSNGNKIDTIIHIGIGGSILGPKFLSEALEDFKRNDFVTNGGRVIAVTSMSDKYQEALNLSYSQVQKLGFEKMYYRKDIGFDL